MPICFLKRLCHCKLQSLHCSVWVPVVAQSLHHWVLLFFFFLSFLFNISEQNIGLFMLILNIDNYSIFWLLIRDLKAVLRAHSWWKWLCIWVSPCVGNQMMNSKACGSHGLCCLGAFQELSTSSVSEKIFSSIRIHDTWFK